MDAIERVEVAVRTQLVYHFAHQYGPFGYADKGNFPCLTNERFTDWLDDIDKEFTILYFWEPNCGHCKEATPKLKAYYDKARNDGIEIFSVCTTSNKQEWTKYIEDNNLTWINGWDPNRSTHFDYYYNVQSTPMIYILDRNKKIIAKKLSVDDIPSFIENYRKYFR